MSKTTKDALGDGCDTLLINVKAISATESQQRFLDAYREDPIIARAARLAGVHRATVYRWMATPEFVAAMKAVAEDFFRIRKAKVLAEEAQRQRWRAARELERRPMRCHNMAIARAARRR